MVLEEELNQKKQELLSTLQPGQIREGTVVRLADFGAFVDLGGVDGLIHNSELSWSRIKHPSEVVQIGDKVQVEIMKFDSEARKVSLSLKHSLEDPWKNVPDQLQEGQIVPATLIKATSNYLLVEVLPGVTGMVPKSEFDPNNADPGRRAAQRQTALDQRRVEAHQRERHQSRGGWRRGRASGRGRTGGAGVRRPRRDRRRDDIDGSRFSGEGATHIAPLILRHGDRTDRGDRVR